MDTPSTSLSIPYPVNFRLGDTVILTTVKREPNGRVRTSSSYSTQVPFIDFLSSADKARRAMFAALKEVT